MVSRARNQKKRKRAYIVESIDLENLKTKHYYKPRLSLRCVSSSLSFTAMHCPSRDPSEAHSPEAALVPNS